MSKGDLVLILGDQLSPKISSLKAADRERDRILLVEVREEATYVRHHKKKIAFIFSAMRHFAEDLATAGWRVRYVGIDDSENTGTLIGEVERLLGLPRLALVLTAQEPGRPRRATSSTLPERRAR